jgi:hypothetical protein
VAGEKGAVDLTTARASQDAAVVMAVPKTVGKKFAVIETVESQSVVLETTYQKISREGWPGADANASTGFFKRPSDVASLPRSRTRQASGAAYQSRA